MESLRTALLICAFGALLAGCRPPGEQLDARSPEAPAPQAAPAVPQMAPAVPRSPPPAPSTPPSPSPPAAPAAAGVAQPDSVPQVPVLGPSETLSLPSGGSQDQGSLTMATVGDSIMVGFWADSTLGSAPSENSLVIQGFIGGLVGARDMGEILREIGESYRGEPSAFAGGIDFDCFSHACRLGIGATNLAVVGAQIHAILGEQVPRIPAGTDYIVLEGGANDVCAEDFDPQVFQDTYRRLLGAVWQRPENPVILVVPVPNVARIFTAIDPLTHTFHFPHPFLGEVPITCRDIRDGAFLPDFAFCPRFAHGATQDDVEAIDQLNAFIAGEIAALDPTGDRLVWGAPLTEVAITTDLLAADCFHPNQAAHRKMADLTWPLVAGKLTLSSPVGPSPELAPPSGAESPTPP